MTEMVFQASVTRFETGSGGLGLMDFTDTPKAVKWLKIRFASSTMVLTNVPTTPVRVAATAVEVEDGDGYRRK